MKDVEKSELENNDEAYAPLDDLDYGMSFDDLEEDAIGKKKGFFHNLTRSTIGMSRTIINTYFSGVDELVSSIRDIGDEFGQNISRGIEKPEVKFILERSGRFIKDPAEGIKNVGKYFVDSTTETVKKFAKGNIFFHEEIDINKMFGDEDEESYESLDSSSSFKESNLEKITKATSEYSVLSNQKISKEVAANTIAAQYKVATKTIETMMLQHHDNKKDAHKINVKTSIHRYKQITTLSNIEKNTRALAIFQNKVETPFKKMSIEYQDKSIRLLKSIFEITRAHKDEILKIEQNKRSFEKNDKFRAKTASELLSSGGGREYGKRVLENLGGILGSTTIGQMFSMGKMGYDVAKMSGGLNIPNILMSMVPGMAMGGGTRFQLDKMNEMFRGLRYNLNSKMLDMRFSDKITPQMLGNIAGIADYKSSRGKFSATDDEALFDQKVYTSIVKVIPALLGKIYGVLAGSDELNYDYEGGAFVTKSTIAKFIDYKRNMAMNTNRFVAAGRANISKMSKNKLSEEGVEVDKKKEMEVDKDFNMIFRNILNHNLVIAPERVMRDSGKFDANYFNRVATGVIDPETNVRLFFQSFNELKPSDKTTFLSGLGATKRSVENFENNEISNRFGDTSNIFREQYVKEGKQFRESMSAAFAKRLDESEGGMTDNAARIARDQKMRLMTANLYEFDEEGSQDEIDRSKGTMGLNNEGKVLQNGMVANLIDIKNLLSEGIITIPISMNESVKQMLYRRNESKKLMDDLLTTEKTQEKEIAYDMVQDLIKTNIDQIKVMKEYNYNLFSFSRANVVTRKIDEVMNKTFRAINKSASVFQGINISENDFMEEEISDKINSESRDKKGVFTEIPQERKDEIRAEIEKKYEAKKEKERAKQEKIDKANERIRQEDEKREEEGKDPKRRVFKGLFGGFSNESKTNESSQSDYDDLMFSLKNKKKKTLFFDDKKNDTPIITKTPSNIIDRPSFDIPQEKDIRNIDNVSNSSEKENKILTFLISYKEEKALQDIENIKNAKEIYGKYVKKGITLDDLEKSNKKELELIDLYMRILSNSNISSNKNQAISHEPEEPEPIIEKKLPIKKEVPIQEETQDEQQEEQPKKKGFWNKVKTFGKWALPILGGGAGLAAVLGGGFSKLRANKKMKDDGHSLLNRFQNTFTTTRGTQQYDEVTGEKIDGFQQYGSQMSAYNMYRGGKMAAKGGKTLFKLATNPLKTIGTGFKNVLNKVTGKTAAKTAAKAGSEALEKGAKKPGLMKRFFELIGIGIKWVMKKLGNRFPKLAQLGGKLITSIKGIFKKKAVSWVSGKLARVAKWLVPAIGQALFIAEIAGGFAFGWGNARNYLGLPNNVTVTNGMRITSALLSMISNMCLNIIPVKFIMTMLKGVGLAGSEEGLRLAQKFHDDRSELLGVDKDRLQDLETSTIGNKIWNNMTFWSKNKKYGSRLFGISEDEYPEVGKLYKNWNKTLQKPSKRIIKETKEKYEAEYMDAVGEKIDLNAVDVGDETAQTYQAKYRQESLDRIKSEITDTESAQEIFDIINNAGKVSAENETKLDNEGDELINKEDSQEMEENAEVSQEGIEPTSNEIGKSMGPEPQSTVIPDKDITPTITKDETKIGLDTSDRHITEENIDKIESNIDISHSSTEQTANETLDTNIARSHTGSQIIHKKTSSDVISEEILKSQRESNAIGISSYEQTTRANSDMIDLMKQQNALLSQISQNSLDKSSNVDMVNAAL